MVPNHAQQAAPVMDYGDFPAGSPVTELGRWCQDSTTFNDGEHDVLISHDFDHGFSVTFGYPYMQISVEVDILQVREEGEISTIDRNVPELAGQDIMDRGITGTVSEIEFIEATNTVLTLHDFEYDPTIRF